MSSLVQTIKFSLRTARLGQSSRWSTQRISRIAQRRLERLIRHAVNRSPYYREKYRGIDLARVSLEHLPPIGKAELRDHFDAVVTDRAVSRANIERFMSNTDNLGRWYAGKYAVSHTSGSQGPGLPIVQDRFCIETLFATIGARANSGAAPGIAEGLRRLRAPNRIAIVAQRRGFYPSAAAFEFMPEIVGPFVRVKWFSAMQADLIDQLNAFQPNSLIGYSSVLEALAYRRADLKLTALRQISNSSEQLTPRIRARIEESFQTPLLDHYGMGECLHLSDGCPTDGGAHVNADWAILEIVDDDYAPVPDGQVGTRVLVTNLANRVQPFIRYEVGDRLAMAITPCRCGSRLPRIERIEGRAAELFWAEGAHGPLMLPGVLFHNAVDSLHEVREWQAVQHSSRRIEIRLELAPGRNGSQPRIRAALSQRLALDGLPATVSLDIQFVPKLHADSATGKFRRMIPLRASEKTGSSATANSPVRLRAQSRLST